MCMPEVSTCALPVCSGRGGLDLGLEFGRLILYVYFRYGPPSGMVRLFGIDPVYIELFRSKLFTHISLRSLSVNTLCEA